MLRIAGFDQQLTSSFHSSEIKDSYCLTHSLYELSLWGFFPELMELIEYVMSHELDTGLPSPTV